MTLPYYHNDKSFIYSYEKTLKMFRFTDNERDIITNEDLQHILSVYWCGLSFGFIKLLLVNKLQAKYIKGGLSCIEFLPPL
jgi:hypothetical protein